VHERVDELYLLMDIPNHGYGAGKKTKRGRGRDGGTDLFDILGRGR